MTQNDLKNIQGQCYPTYVVQVSPPPPQSKNLICFTLRPVILELQDIFRQVH